MKETIKEHEVSRIESFERDRGHSMEVVATLNDVTFINDSKSTSAKLAAESINSIDAELVLILGGDDMKTDYSRFSFSNYYNIRTVIYFGKRIAEIKHIFSKHVMVLVVDNLEHAVQLSKAKAIANQAVLFSPACQSADASENYKIRGDKFKDYVLGTTKSS